MTQKETDYTWFNFLSKDQLTKKKDRILIKDLISNKWKYKTKKQGWFYSREYMIFWPIFRKARPSFVRVLQKILIMPGFIYFFFYPETE